MNYIPEIDFTRIRSVGSGGKREGFEELFCELARHDSRPPSGSRFDRFRGAGGDGGVEALHVESSGAKWGWQSKYIFDVDAKQLNRSVEMALDVHPDLVHYAIALPFDPTGKKKGKGRSQIEKLEELRTKWSSDAVKRGKSTTFEFIYESGLKDRLKAIDANGVRIRYWFDATALNDAWWNNHLTVAAEAARPRYVPELRIDLPVFDGFNAITKSPQWRSGINKLARDFSKACESAGRGDAASPDMPPAQDVSTLKQLGKKVGAAFDSWGSECDESSRVEVLRCIDVLASSIADAEALALGNLDKKYGPGKADDLNWREWMREYQVSFPTSILDSIRRLGKTIRRMKEFLEGPNAILPSTSVAVLTGPAGVGKTFAAIDVAYNRHDKQLPTVMLHGRWFSDRSDPLVAFAQLLGISGSPTPDEVFGLLDQAGEAATTPVLVIIDALNETIPHSIWHDHVDRFVSMSRKYQHVRVVLTIRTHYLEEILPNHLILPTWEHRGFSGVEADAVFAYAQHYKLEPPAAPPAQREFSNPLFLRLLCEASASSGKKGLETGLGLSDTIELLLTSKDTVVSQRLDAPVNDRIVRRAIMALAGMMSQASRLWLPRHQAQAATRSIWPDATRSKSLLEALIAEGLLSEDRLAGVGDIVAMAFERLGQHMVITEALSSFANAQDVVSSLGNGTLHALVVRDGTADLGMLEALAIAVPQRWGTELQHGMFQGAVTSDAFLKCVLGGLHWRNPGSVTPETEMLVGSALNQIATIDDALEALFSLSIRDSHPLNMDWFHGGLCRLGMADRDARLIPWLFKHQSGHAVGSLIRWAREFNVETLSDDVARLWVIALLWCTSCSDRRIRDGATRGVVRLLIAKPHIAGTVLSAMMRCDDEWVIERTLASVYAAYLCGHDTNLLTTASEMVWKGYWRRGHLPTNVVIRDLARCILHQAFIRGCSPPGFDIEKLNPPLGPSSELDWPDEKIEKQYESKAGYPKLARSCIHDDFAHYQVEPVLDDFEGIDPKSAGRWILREVIALGYSPGHFAWFDSQLLRDFGQGRAKPQYVERVGKKYQWIALARLAGLVADSVPREVNTWDPPRAPTDLQGRRLRDIDPSILGYPKDEDGDQVLPPWVASYAWNVASKVSENDWAVQDDWPEVSVLIPASMAESGKERIVLGGTYRWRQPEGENEERYPYRHIWTHIHSVLVRAKDQKALVNHWNKTEIIGNEPVGADIGEETWVGEYPFGLPLTENFRIQAHYGTKVKDLPVDAWPTTNRLMGEFEYDGTGWTRIGLDLPSERFFGTQAGALRWNGRGAWTQGDCVVAANTHVDGERELTMDREWLDSWLKQNRLTLVWTEVSARDVVTGLAGRGSRRVRTRVLWWNGKTLRARAPRTVNW